MIRSFLLDCPIVARLVSESQMRGVEQSFASGSSALRPTMMVSSGGSGASIGAGVTGGGHVDTAGEEID